MIHAFFNVVCFVIFRNFLWKNLWTNWFNAAISKSISSYFEGRIRQNLMITFPRQCTLNTWNYPQMNLMYVMIHVEMFINEINSCIYAPMLVIEVPTAPKIASEPLLTSSTTILTHVIGILYQYTISYIYCYYVISAM